MSIKGHDDNTQQYIFLNRISKKLVISVLIFSSALFLVNAIAIGISYQYSNQKLFHSQVNAAVEQVDYQLTAVNIGMEELSENPIIIKFLNEGMANENFEVDIMNMAKLLKGMESISVNISYMSKLWLVNLKDHYLVSSDGLDTNVNMTIRPWYDDVIANPEKSVMTKIHPDLFTGYKNMSLVTKVYDLSGEVIGFILMDIYVDDLIQNLIGRFTVPKADAYIVDKEEGSKFIDRHISKENGVTTDFRECFDGAIQFGFSYSESDFIKDPRMGSILIVLILFFILFNIIIILIFRETIKKAFEPMYRNLGRLKRILQHDERSTLNMENMDEFEQLEVMTHGIYNSIRSKIKEKKELIYYDRVTGLPNRYSLEIRVEELIRQKKPFALFFLDLDNFKYINDRYGYELGDRILKAFGQLIQEEVGDKAMVTRYTGDEFVMIYEGYNREVDPHNARKLDVIWEYFSKEITVEDIVVNIGFSVGCSSYNTEGDSLEELLKKSHFMCLEHKKATGSEKKYKVFFKQEMYDKMLRDTEIKNSLKAAFENKEFYLYFQPIQDDKKVVKCEVLMRWISPEYGFISPAEFIQYAEESGLIVRLGYWLIEESFKRYNMIRSEMERAIAFSINVSALQLAEKGFSERIHQLAQIYGVNRQEIVFEITENILIQGNRVLMTNLKNLRQLGFKIALDDFGTGYSSFSYLERFDLDILKIDKSFVDNKVKKEEYEIVKRLIQIAHVLGLEVIVEGVETKEQFEILKAINCDYFQGYYFAKPLAFEDFREYLNIYAKKIY